MIADTWKEVHKYVDFAYKILLSHLHVSLSNPALLAKLLEASKKDRADSFDAAFVYAFGISPIVLYCGFKLDSKPLNQLAWYEVRQSRSLATID